MSHTVIGIFDHTSEAQAAICCLVSKGFIKESIDLSTRAEMEGITSPSTQEEAYEGIGSFFSHLFGSHTDTDKYSKVGQRGAIVTVHANSVEQAESAAQILDKYDALDVHERTEFGAVTGTMPPLEIEATHTIKITEDKIQDDKNGVETSGMRLRSRII